MTKTSNSSVFKNTLIMYARMFFSLFVALFTSRVVMKTLGVEDYGINAVVGGLIGMFGVIQTSMIGATSRFLTFEMGKGDFKKLKDTFSTTLTVHIIIALILFVLLETIGLWFVNHKLVIPQERMFAANCIYQFSILSTMVSVTQTPYSSCVVAHERFSFYAYMDILSTSLKLLILYLLKIGLMDKLILYGILTLAVHILMRTIHRIYCIRNFPESHYHFTWDKRILKSVLSFSFWDVFRNVSIMARGEGVALLINMFFGPAMNAAEGIASSVHVRVSRFSTNITVAARPQLIKRYAEGNIKGMSELMSEVMRLNFILQTFLTIPLICEMTFILKLWLGLVPETACEFSILSLLFTVAGTIGGVAIILIHATGRVKMTSIINGIIYILVIPVTYFSFSLGMPAWIPYLYNTLAFTSTSLINIYLLDKYIPQFSGIKLITNDIFRCVIMYCIVFSITFSLHFFISEGFLRTILAILISSTITAIYSYFFILTKELKHKVLIRIQSTLHKIHLHK